jgi:hypothetical protein
VADLQAALGELFRSYRQSRQHDFTRDFLVLDEDLSPLPASNHAEGSERGYMGRSRSKTGRKLARVRAAATQEIVWETVITGRRVESLPILQEAIYGMESRLGLQGNDASTRKQRGRTEIREDARLGQWTQHHLALRTRLSGDRQVQIRRAGPQAGAWDQHLAAHLQTRAERWPRCLSL